MRKSILSILAFMLFAVLPVFSAIQYNLGPVDFESGTIPAGWTQQNVVGTVSWAVEGGAGASLTEPLNANGGVYRAAIRPAADNSYFKTRLESSAMDLTQAYNPQLKFSHAQVARFEFFDTLRVYYRVNATATWQLLTEYTSSIAGWTSETMLLPAYQQGSAYQLAFEASGQNGYGVVLDDISVYPQSQCQDALFQGINVSSTSATIGFTCNGSYNHFELAVSSTPITDFQNVNLDTLTYHGTTEDFETTVTGLQPYTTYYVYLRTDCDDNISGYTNWVQTTLKTTSMVNLPYSETFTETETISGNAYCGKPYGWITGGLTNVNVPCVYKGSGSKYSYSVDSTNYLFFSGTASTTATPVPADSLIYAITPEINGNLANCEVDFWGTAYTYLSNGGNQDYAAELTVGVVTNPYDIGTLQVIETVKIDNGEQFKHFRVSLAGYTGTGKHVALVSMASKPNIFYVDNFTIKEVNVCTPTNLRATNVLPTGFTLTPQLNGADSWNLKVSTVYNRDASLIADSLVLVNQTGLTAASYQVQLPAAANAEGKIIVVYVQGVKNGVASEWSAPLTLHVPTTGVVPMFFDFSTNATFNLQNLINELHTSSIYKGFKDLISPMLLQTTYPRGATSIPVYDGAYLALNGVDNYVAFPYVANPSELEITFRLSSGSTTYAGSGRVAVGVMTDPYDLSTFVELGRFDAADGTFAKVRQTLDSYTGNGHYIAIRALSPVAPNSTYGSHNCIDNVRIKTISTCLDPTNVTANTMATNATVLWNPNGMTEFKLTLYSNYDSAWVDTVIYKTTAAGSQLDSITLTGLTPDTEYEFTLQTICGNDTIIAEDVYSFRTKIGVPYVPTLLPAAIPTGWTRKSGLLSDVFLRGDSAMATTTSGWTYNNVVNVVGLTNPHLRLNIFGVGVKYWLISPEISMDLQPDEVAALTFKAAWTKYKASAGAAEDRIATSTDDKFAVVISTDGGKTWKQNDAFIWANDGTGNRGMVDDIPYTAVTITIPLGDYVGQRIMIGFYGESTVSGGDNDFRISDIRIGAIDASCQGMSKLNAVATGSTTADINWTVGGTQKAYLKVTNAVDSTVIYADTVTANPLVLTNLQPNTLYNVLGYQVCSDDTLTASFRTECDAMTIEQFGTETFIPATSSFTCWRVGANDTTGVGNSKLALPDVVNKAKFGYVLTMEKLANTSTKAYGNDYYAILPTLQVDSISKYQVVFDAATPNALSDTTIASELYIGVITDVENFSTLEIIDTVSLKYAADSTEMKTYAISFDSYIGDYKGYFGKNVIFLVSAPAEKKNTAYIDNVRFEVSAGCHQVIDLEQTVKGSTAVTLTWSGKAAQYEVVMDTVRFDPALVANPMFSQTGITADSVLFTNLTPGTTYYAYIRGICGAADTSVWSSFTKVETSYGLPYLETFDLINETYPTSPWKVFNQTVPSGDFSTAGFTVSNADTRMSIQQTDARMSNMAGKVARTEVYSATYNGFLQSPAIDLSNVADGLGIQLSFRAGMVPFSSSTTTLADMTGRTFRVYVSEDGGETFKAENMIEWNCEGTGDYDYATLNNNAGTKFLIDLSDYVGKTIALGFYSASTVNAPDAYLLIDSVALEAYDNSCQGITQLRYGSEGKNMYVTWSNQVQNLGVVVELATDAEFSNIIRRDSIVGDSVYYSNLAYSTTYYVRANPECVGSWNELQFTTLCGVPFTEDFDKTGTTVPAGWLRYTGDFFSGDVSTTTSIYFSTSAGGGLTSPHVYWSTTNSSSSGPKQYAFVSPEIVMDQEGSNNLLLTFDLAVTTTSSGTTAPTNANCVGRTFAVAVLAEDSTNWTPIRVWKDSAYKALPSVAEKQTFDLTAYAGQKVRIAFYAGADSTSTTATIYHNIDNIRVRNNNPACEAPVLQANGFTNTTASLKWQVETGMQYKLQIANSTAFYPLIDSLTTTDSVHTFTNLTPGSILYVRAKKVCSAGCESAWSEYVRMQLPCEGITVYPWSENFDNVPTGTFEKACWYNEHLAGTGYKLFEGYTAALGGNVTGKLSHPMMTNGTQTLLALPQMTFDQDKVYRLSVNLYRGASSATSYTQEGIRVFLSDGAYINGQSQEIVFLPRNITVASALIPAEDAVGWYTYSFIFRTSGDKTIVLRGETMNGGNCYIDDLVVEEFGTTQTIDQVTIDQITNRSARLKWSLVDPSICHDAEIVASLTALDSAALAQAPKQTVQNSLSAVVEGLDREAHYYMYVRTVCGSTYGDWMMAECTTKPLTYENQAQFGDGTANAYVVYTSYGNTYSQHIYLADELSEAGLTPGPITSVAFEYTGTSANFDKTQSIYIGATSKNSYPGSAATNFETNLQLAYGPTLRTYQQGWVTYTFTEPFIWDGVSNIVVGVLTNGDGSHSSSSGWSAAGTAQNAYLTIYRYIDRTLVDPANLNNTTSSGGYSKTRPNARFTNSITMEACPAVETVEAELYGLGITEARVSWAASLGNYVADYDVFVSTEKLADSAVVTPQYTGIDSLSLVLTNLTPETKHYIYVRANCDARGHDDGVSSWAMDSITTYANCMPVKDLAVRFMDVDKVEVSWDKYMEEQDNDFRYILSTAALDSTALEQADLLQDTTMHLVFDSLQLETTYYFYVRSTCSEKSSTWRSITFTTPASCQAVDSLHVDRLSAHAVRLAWQHAPLAFEDQWEVGIVGQPAFTQLTADTFVVISGLQNDSAYTAYVRAICSEGDTSVINTVSFQTASAGGEECIYTAESSTTNGYNTPFNNFYKNSWAQMIYPASLIGASGDITSISFYCAAGGNLTQESVKIYLANTDMTVAAATSDWIAESELSLVCDITDFVHPTSAGWVTIPLSTPFAYTGGNLAVVVAVHATNYSSSIKYSYVASPSGTVLYRRSDSDTSCGDYPTAAGLKATYLPIAQFCIQTGGCSSVSDIVVEDITTNSASASWFPGNDETAWRTFASLTKLTNAELATVQADTVTLPKQQLSLLADKDYYFYVAPICSDSEDKWKYTTFATLPTCLKPVRLALDSVTTTTAALHFCYGGTEPAPAYEVAYGSKIAFNLNDTATYQTVIVSDTTALLTGLTANTYYNVAVRSLCGDDDYSRWCDPITILTDCGITTEYPWGEDFEAYSSGNFLQQCWVNRHTVTAGSYGSYVFQIASMSGIEGVTTNVMKLPDQSAGNITLLSSPEMLFPEDQMLEFSIDVYRSNYSSIKQNEGLRIYVSATDTIDESAQLLAFIPRQYSVEGINASATDTIRWESYHFPIIHSGVGHILIEGVSEYGTATYFDNLSLTYLDTLCGGVAGFEISDITINTAEARWMAIGNDTVEVYVTDEANTQVFSRITTADSITITGLAPGTKYKIAVTQLCSGRMVKTSFFTQCTTPFFENATKPTNWISYYSSANGSYYWKNTSTASYILGEMQDTVFYLQLYYLYDVWSRLTSPEIYIPEVAADEAVRLDWLMGATTYSTRGGSRLDSSTVVRMEVRNLDDAEPTWIPMQSWSDSLLTDIPWGTSGRFTANLSQFAGHTIQLGFYAGITEADSSTVMSIDNINLRVIKKRSYSATTCSSVDYQDAYFSIPKQEYVLGTTDYETLLAGNDGALDTLVVLSLTVNPATETELYDTICEGRLYDQNGVPAFIATESVVKPLFLTSANGCDSLVRVHIEVIPAMRKDTTILACKGSAVTVNGKTYYSDIVVVDTLGATNRCDSIVRTFIEFSDTEKYTVDQHRIICAGDTYTDEAFPNGINTAGTHTATVTTAYGCDSTVTIHMSVANNGLAYDTVTLDQLPYVYAEDTILGDNVGVGDFEFKVQASCGEVTLYIHVTDKAQAVDNLKVLQLSVAPNPASVGEPIEILSQVSMAPDFSMMVFDAIGQLVYATDEPTLTIPGLPVAGYYTVRLTSDGQSFQAKLLVK